MQELSKATKFISFDNKEIELIDAGYRLNYQGRWESPDKSTWTVKLIPYGNYSTGMCSLDGRFVIQHYTRDPMKTILFDAYCDFTIIRSKALNFSSKRVSKLVCPSTIEAKIALFDSYWHRVLEHSNYNTKGKW